jgi:hypothetical protein
VLVVLFVNREIDQMLNRIHKLTKHGTHVPTRNRLFNCCFTLHVPNFYNFFNSHAFSPGYDGKRERAQHESHPQVLTPEQEKDHQKAKEQKKEHQEASHEVQEKKPQEHATELHNHLAIHKKLDDSRPKRLVKFVLVWLI